MRSNAEGSPQTKYCHTSVLPRETIDGLGLAEGGICCDGTLGGGGHAALICEKIGGSGTLIGIDRDGEAIAAARKRLEQYPCKKLFSQANFENIRAVLAKARIPAINGAALDLGVSSRQLDEAGRGFSYMNDGPLDMRMDGSAENAGPSAADVINEYDEKELCRIIRDYGEERWAKRIASFIVDERRRGRIESTGELTEIIKRAIPAAARRDGPHPAKRTFQAIRIEVNDELGALERSLGAFIDVLKPGGRLAVITFHSLEDRIVKESFRKREAPCECPKGIPVCVCGKTADARRVTRKPILPTEGEMESNPRARSAKLRILEKL
ncbi:MAG: 16S rRNA (cytosine(1402)-N(4))-methyltransferase RsmH [Clostridiales Family XIII bacterium]|jgi:16S rRNA (cytosine1402-N4)-methyltransferase|nr:16S rRNA (cytosine(1402)-N(4))-methyltransferase RsmH [Clostridiales Family XIII bacterium]